MLHPARLCSAGRRYRARGMLTAGVVAVPRGQAPVVDTRVTWEEVGKDVISAVKLFPAKSGAIYGMTGGNCTGVLRAVEWLQSDRSVETRPMPPEYEVVLAAIAYPPLEMKSLTSC